jgi:hypothetical protein
VKRPVEATMPEETGKSAAQVPVPRRELDKVLGIEDATEQPAQSVLNFLFDFQKWHGNFLLIIFLISMTV